MLKKIALIFCVGLALCACSSSNTAATGGRQPDWVRDPYTKYDRQANVAAVGSGRTREGAEKSALRNLVAVFGQSIQVDEKVFISYQETQKNGANAKWREETDVGTDIIVSTGMDSLVGAEIGEVWGDGKEYYAVSVLNKAKAFQVYSGMVRSNHTMIDNLANIPPEEKNTLHGLLRYQLAGTVADVTASYVNLLSAIGGPPLGDIKSGDEYRFEAANIARAIPVGLAVRNDKAGRIEGAFARALSDLGFQSGGDNSPYVLEVDIAATPVALANNPNKFTRIELSASLTDAHAKIVLLPYNFNDRQGHLTQAEADNRAYASAERKVNEEYANLLRAYFLLN